MHAPLQQSHSGCPLGTQKTHSRCCRVNRTHFTEQLLSNNFLAIDTIQINQFLKFLGHICELFNFVLLTTADKIYDFVASTIRIVVGYILFFCAQFNVVRVVD